MYSTPNGNWSGTTSGCGRSPLAYVNPTKSLKKRGAAAGNPKSYCTDWIFRTTCITACDRKQLNAIRHVSARPWRSGKAGNSGRFLQYLFTRLITQRRFSQLVLRSENSRNSCGTGTSATDARPSADKAPKSGRAKVSGVLICRRCSRAFAEIK